MSDLEEFALDVLQRAKARSKVLKETLGKPDVAPAIETETHDDSGDENVVLVERKLEVTEQRMIAMDSPPKAFGPSSTIESAKLHLSDSPARRTRLRALAQTINNWDDDYSHHYTPQSSRFNLSKPKSPLRKPGSPSTVPDNRVRFEPKSIRQESSVDTVDSRPSSTISQQVEKLCSTELVVGSTDKSFDECDASYNSSVGDELLVACCSDEGETSKNSELSDSFTYFTSKPDHETNVEGNKGIVSKSGECAEQKCVLDDSVIHALIAQGYVHSPASSKLYYEYKDTKENKPQQYQLPGPAKNEPVKRAASPVRPTPVCSKTPSPVKAASPAVTAENAPRVVDLFRKQFEGAEKFQENKEKLKPVSTAARLEAGKARVCVAQKAALYESMNTSTVREVDPTELSVAERMKLFEKKKTGPATSSFVPKIPTSPTRNAGSVSGRRPPRPSMVPAMPLKERLRLFEQGTKEEDSGAEDEDEAEGQNNGNRSAQMKPDVVPVTVPPPPPPPMPIASPKARAPSPKKLEPSLREHELRKMGSPKRVNSPSKLHDIQEIDAADASEEDNTLLQTPPRSSPTREVSFAALPKSPKRFSSPQSVKRSMSPKANYPGTRDVKRIRVNDPKPGRIYPSLTDIETTETETDTDMENADIRPLEADADEEMDSETSTVSGVSSLGAFIERKAIENSPLRASERHPRYRPSEDFNASLACRQVDALIDEALEGQDYSMSMDIGSSPVATSSPLKNANHSPSPVLTKPMNPNLVHTVSFYRRQQTLCTASPKVTLTPKRTPVPVNDSPIEERTFSQEDQVNEIIKKLEVEAQSQQRSMAQASKALSLCKATMEFSDSRENVECERVLLIATHKHSALVNEIHRLKTEGILGRLEAHSPSKGDFAPSCKGNMTVSDVSVELKREFLARAMKGETVYHFLGLLKYRNQLEASSLLSLGSGVNTSHLRSGVLHFPNSFTFTNLEPDFKVTLEVFVFETLREYLPHEAKYHIKKNEKGKLTPKKLKHDAHSKFTHFQHSPAGPDAVQPCKFKSVGSLTVDISTLQRSHWQFERTTAAGPLEGSVAMKIQCSAEGGVEECGFLTMFTDISGYGDWHRRWCRLTSTEMSYWMYPEDEPNEPIGRIVLRHCVTSRVGPVPRDVCARANTFLLVTTRPPLNGDRDTLVTSCHEDYTAVRHLISADTKEERDLWCRKFNRALANLRAWDPHAQSPDDTLF